MRVLAAALAMAGLLLAPLADAATVRHKPTGFRAKVPRGFKLRYDARSKAYTIANKKSWVRLLFATSSTEADTAGREILRAAGGQVYRSGGTPDRFTADVGVNGVLLHLQVTRTGGQLRVATFGPLQRRARAAVPRQTGLLELTAAQLATLQRIAGGAQARGVQLSADIPLRPCVARDGSAQAFVPDRPGWVCDGAAGEIAGGNATEGVFAFGLPFIVLTPYDPSAGSGQFPVSFPLGPVDTILGVLPIYFRINGGDFSNPQVTGIVPGTENFLGPSASGGSGMFGVRFTAASAQWEGLISIGTTLIPGDIFGNWYVYMSYIAVPSTAPAGMGAALFQTWASWDPSADQQRRRNQTIYTILTTNFGGGPIDPDVFDAANEKWGAYIRE